MSKFQIPQKLYGREKEVNAILESFQKTCEGNIEIMLISGFSGIGKSNLVKEIHKPILVHRGYFISGKYDQFQNNIPYSAIINAFRDLIRQILTENTDRIQNWKIKLLNALGENGQVLINVIPELELIIGQSKPVQELSPNESQNRFKFVFQNFVKAIATKEHPLVLFLDDLQWGDNASYLLIKSLLSLSENLSLFFIGAYRDNEVNPTHPFILTLNEIEAGGNKLNNIRLEPLQLSHVNQLIAESLNSTLSKTVSLAELVFSKTEGNPFFIGEFLKSIYSDKLFHFDSEILSWTWDINKIQKRGIADNVIDLMAGKIKTLSLETQNVLKLAACIGNRFDLNTLSIILSKTKVETASSLWEALEKGLILPTDDSYKFVVESNESNPQYQIVHDRIQQAIYSLIPDSEKKTTHLQIGRLLLKRYSNQNLEDKILDIINHLNLAEKNIILENEKIDLAYYNFLAGKKSKSSSAYALAFQYLQTSIKLLPPNYWEIDYKFSIELYTVTTEIACVLGEFESVKELSLIILENAKTLSEKAKIYDTQILAFIAQNKVSEAINTALDILNLLGVKIPAQPSEADIGAGIGNTHALWTKIGIEGLLTLPEMVDPEKLAAIQIISSVMPVTYTAAPILVPMFTFAMIELSIKYGNAHASTFGYASYGLILCGAVGDIDTGYEFGQLAINLLNRLNANEFKARTYFYVYLFIIHWKKHLTESLAPFLDGYRVGMETGDITNSVLDAMQYCVHAYVAGKNLPILLEEMDKFSQTMKQHKQDFVLLFNELFRYAAKTWTEIVDDSYTPYFESYYNSTLPILLETNNISGLWIIYLNRMIYNYSIENYTEALEESINAEKNIAAASGSVTLTQYYLYDSLIRLNIYNNSNEEEKSKIIERVTANQEKMKKWAEKAPMNFQHKFDLIEAERNRLNNNLLSAIELFEKSISNAKENQYIQEEALANELAVNLYLSWGKENFASIYLKEAIYAYQRWGSSVKVNQLKKKYSHLLKIERKLLDKNILSTSITSLSNTENVTSSGNSFLDIGSVIKASQTIAGEIHFGKLLTKMMEIVLENAGAEKGLFLLKQNEKWLIQAEGHSNPKSIEVLQSKLFTVSEKDTISPNFNFSASIINYVIRTQSIVLLDDASSQSLFINDSYILHVKPKSILCYPILNQGQLVSIMYLENNLTTFAFTPHRIELLKILTSQIAVSVENSLLYANLEEKVTERTIQLEEAHKKILVLEKDTTEKQLAGGFAHEMRNALVGPKLVIQHLLGQDGREPFESLNLENNRKLKEIYLAIKDQLPGDVVNTILKDMKVIFENEEKLENGFKMIYKAVSKGLSITQQIMDYAKVGNEQIGKNQINLNTIIESIVSEYQNNWTEHKITIHLELTKESPLISGLESHFESVFKNLILNAKDAVLDNGIKDTRVKLIVVKTLIQNNNFYAEITDNGIGIQSEHIARIYDAFFSTKPDSGTGLGLGVVKKILNLYNGNIEVKSEFEKGTTFTISLPIF